MKRPLVLTAVISYLALVASGFYLLNSSRTGGHILSPWQTIHPAYIYVFFVATLLLGLLIIFSDNLSRQRRVSLGLIILIILHSLLLHSYLPLTHQLIYGADQWRHIANETQILAWHWPSKPMLSDGSSGNGLEIGNWKLEIGDFAYGLFWLVSAAVSKITGLGLVAVTKWFQPILFSIAFPLLLWKLTEYLGFRRRERFLTIWFANFPFALQAAGAFSLPVNFGFLFFLGGLIILAARARSAAWATRKIIFLYAAVLAVNYLLFLILFLVGWGIVEDQSSKFKVQSLIWLVVPVAIVIPAIELLAGYSHFSAVDGFGQLKQFVGNFIGYFLAAGPQPHVIAAGNIFFNQIPGYAFVPNLLTIWRWWIPVFMVVFLGVVIFGIVKPSRAAAKDGHRFISVMFAGLFLSYLLSRYFLTGEQVLSRRLDAMLALFGILAFMMVKERMVAWAVARGQSELPNLIVFVLLGSVAIAASYSLGPNTDTVSASDYQAMQYVWSQEKDSKTHCVIADTYPLLALEAISGKEIIGGGFPINAYFAQPELQKIYSNIKNSKEVGDSDLAEAKKLTGAASCWMMKSGEEARRL